ncbi:MAG: flagellar filament capping protein FliD [Treponema sp.]|nr:flagellar filament capping protein FliD [Treponema sp.]
MAGISIPGVTDKYNSNATVEKLMQVERIPLTREESQLEQYKSQKDAWREITSQLTSLRDSTKDLYSYDNPFNNKITTSSDEAAITATANRSAEIQSFKIDVIQPATSDRFLSAELPSDEKVPAGMYTYRVGEKSVNINWKGGTLKDFSNALNKRSNGLVKSMIIGASAGKKTLLIESLATGKENRLIFEGAAKEYAISSGMVTPVKSQTESFGTKKSDLQSLTKKIPVTNKRMPELSVTKIKTDGENITVEPRGGFQLNIPSSVTKNANSHVSFTIRPTQVEDITEKINSTSPLPEIPEPGFAEFEGIRVNNSLSDTLLNIPVEKPEPVNSIVNQNLLYAIMNDGTEMIISTPNILSNSETTIDLDLSNYAGIKGIAVKNENTGYKFDISSFTAYDASQAAGYTPNNAITVAGDAIIKYEGITITRPSNQIDDVIPEITLNLHEKTEKTATIKVQADKDASKNALIEFVGKYNQAVAKLNVLSQNKEEIVNELDYLSSDEKDKLREQLGMFQTDFSLSSIKSNMASILNTTYRFSDEAEITMLAQIGISTNASGAGSTYSSSRLRGYLEIDEKKLDDALENHLDDVKAIFGYDSDGDLIVDTGIAYKMDKQIGAYTQTGGILALKTSTLDSKIKSSETKIARLEDQMKDKEAELRQKYSSMEGSLNSLESQQTAITNFTNQQNRQK